ncbi:hypothetical protein L3X38_026979 [Prunus dulcis]|uniref:Uncharacterized protein n=1 Tax=Prunus dulcis TaxID=3755 RepID=A0AAD4VNA6_PRUDU|nr:hypothetical protein L3X38_026979 [Prunus dulcis]
MVHHLRAPPPQRTRARQRQGKQPQARAQARFVFGPAQACGLHQLPGLAFVCWSQKLGLGHLLPGQTSNAGGALRACPAQGLLPGQEAPVLGFGPPA